MIKAEAHVITCGRSRKGPATEVAYEHIRLALNYVPPKKLTSYSLQEEMAINTIGNLEKLDEMETVDAEEQLDIYICLVRTVNAKE